MKNEQLIIRDFSNKHIAQVKEDLPKLKVAFCNVAEQIARVSGKAIPPEDVVYMVNYLFDKHPNEKIETHLKAWEMLAVSKTFGSITLFSINDCMETVINENIDERNRQHEQNKGFGDVEVAKRISGRISDHFNKE